MDITNYYNITDGILPFPSYTQHCLDLIYIRIRFHAVRIVSKDQFYVSTNDVISENFFMNTLQGHSFNKSDTQYHCYKYCCLQKFTIITRAMTKTLARYSIGRTVRIIKRTLILKELPYAVWG